MSDKNTTHTTIETKLQSAFNPSNLSIENESHMHSGPATDSHFKLTIVSDEFAGKRPVGRHQAVYAVLADELAGPVHALAMHLFTNDEWQASSQNVQASPNCRGGSK